MTPNIYFSFASKDRETKWTLMKALSWQASLNKIFFRVFLHFAPTRYRINSTAMTKRDLHFFCVVPWNLKLLSLIACDKHATTTWNVVNEGRKFCFALVVQNERKKLMITQKCRTVWEDQASLHCYGNQQQVPIYIIKVVISEVCNHRSNIE